MGLNTDTLKLAEELTQIIGVSGNEKYISNILKQHYEKYTDEIIFDNLGSMYAVKRCKKENPKKVMISANMDEIGFMVNEITDMGLLKLLPLGNISAHDLVAKRVRLINNQGKEFIGSIVTKSTEQDKTEIVKDDEILADVGVTSKEEIKELGIKLGDSVVLDGEFKVLGKGERILSKAWNNRYGCLLGIEVLESLKNVELDVDLYVGCTVQHEVGLRGAETATNLVKPDLGIVVDCLQANDVSGKNNAVGKLGEGVLINYYDKSMMPNRALLNHLVETCKLNNIKYQSYYSMKENDSKWIHKLLTGCPTLMTCICARNINTNNSIIDTNDYLAAKKAVINVVKSLNTKKVEEFKAENR